MSFELDRPLKNQSTQPAPTMAVFNNWAVVADGWYFVCPSKDLPPEKVKGFNICGQELAIWRGKDHRLRATDAFCPHMGTHLGIGKVVDNDLRCFFHHWKFDGSGKCIEIPCQKEIPSRAQLASYTVIEKFEAIWIHPSSQARPLTDFNEIETGPLEVHFGDPYERSCHHHVTMINGLDPQHLRTVHNLDINMKIEMTEDQEENVIDIVLSGDVGNQSWKERWAQKILGPTYSYGIKYDHANNGFLTLMKDAKLWKRWPLPSLHMIFAYRPLSKGRTLVQPIYVTRKREGLWGLLKSQVLIFLTKRAFFSLQGEDGQVYENMRFFPANLLPMDRPVAQYIQYVNRLPTSEWSL